MATDKFFLALTILYLSSTLGGVLFLKLKMPKVIGEIFGGLLMGPTLIGTIFKDFHQHFFTAQIGNLEVISGLGLVLLMFCSGFEIERNFNKKDTTTIIAVTITSTIIPFIFGWYISSFFNLESIIGTANNVTSLKLVIAVIMAITSIPVISKIFFDLNIMNTQFAKLILSIATIHDIILWVFLSIATGLVSNTHSNFGDMAFHIGITVLLFICCLILVPFFIKKIDSNKIYNLISGYEFVLVLIVLFLFVILSYLLKINVVFGALLAGTIIGLTKNDRMTVVKNHIKEFSFALFIPIYFSMVGLKIDLIHHFDASFFLYFFLFAFTIQGVTVLLTTKALGYTWLSSSNVAVAMNARGGPGIVIATIAYSLGIINENFFSSLILLSILTSLIAGVWLRYITSRKYPLLK